MIFKRKMQAKVISKFFQFGFLGLFVVVFAGCPNEGDILVNLKKNDSATGVKVVSEKKNSIQSNEVEVGGWVGVNDVEEAIKGQGTKEEPYQIAHPNHFERVRANLSAHYKVVNNLDFSGMESFKSIGGVSRKLSAQEIYKSFRKTDKYGGLEPFEGTFDGNGKTIKGIKVKGSVIAKHKFGFLSRYIGFFGVIGKKGVVNNVYIENIKVQVGRGYYIANQLGGLAGINYGRIEKSSVKGGIIGGTNKSFFQFFGGLVGTNIGEITKSHSMIQVLGNDRIGGLVAENYGTIQDSYSISQVSGYQRIGGLVGDNYGRISNSYSKAEDVKTKVTGSLTVGGLTAWNSRNGKIENSYAQIPIEGRNLVGGLVGHNLGLIRGSHATGSVLGGSYVGGLVGDNYNRIEDSYSTGEVRGIKMANYFGRIVDSTYVGGLIGKNTIIGNVRVSNSYATGNVFGNKKVGSLVGGHQSGIIEECYATGKVTASGELVKNFIGEIIVGEEGKIINSGFRKNADENSKES